MKRWHQRTALITGASSGIGAALARQLAAGGCHLVLTARRRDRLEALGDELAERHGVIVDVIAQDLAAPDGAQRLYDEVVQLGRNVSLLVNNAGFGTSGPFAAQPPAAHAAQIQVNVTALVTLTSLVLPSMLERGRGDILLVSSIAAYLPVPKFAVYAASKAFVTHFGEALAFELEGTGVQVTVLNPGGTRTEFHQAAGMASNRLQDLGSMTADEVARQGLRALARQRRSTIAGTTNRTVMWAASRLLPLDLKLRAAAVFQRLAGGE